MPTCHGFARSLADLALAALISYFDLKLIHRVLIMKPGYPEVVAGPAPGGAPARHVRQSVVFHRNKFKGELERARVLQHGPLLVQLIPWKLLRRFELCL